jgi:multidrug resistance protein
MAFATTLRLQVIEPLRTNAALLLICVATGVIMLGQGIISPVLPLYADAFGVSAAMVGATISVFGLARLLLNLPAGFLSDRFGRRLLLIGGPAVTAVGSFLSASAGDIWQLLAYRFIAGAGSAMFMTGAMIVVTDIATPENRGRMLSIYQGSLLLGVSIGPAVGGLTAELAGLRAPFVLVGALALACAVWAAREMPETNVAARALRDPSRADDPPPTPTTSVSYRDLFLNPGFVLVSLVTFSVFFTRTGSRQTVLALVGSEDLGLSAGAIGGIFAMMAVLNLVVIGPSGAWADRLGRKRVIVPSALLTAGALALFALAPRLGPFLIASVLLGIGTGMVGPAPAAYAADVIPPAARGVGMGLYRTYGDLGFVVGPPLLGWVADATGDFGWALGLNAVIMAVLAVLFGLFARETVTRPRPETTGVSTA